MFAFHHLSALNFLAVGLGAAFGAWTRWLLGLALNPLFIALPLGTLAANLLGGYLVGVEMIGVDAGAFWSQMQGGVDWIDDVGNGVLKSVVFGFTVAFVALFVGYEAEPTPEGVAHATTTTVVVASLAVLALDFVLTALMFSSN